MADTPAEELPIGTRDAAGTAATLDLRRFNRHTFWCGQSGSGKTYALGVALERVLLETRLPMVVFDPNSDFVSFGEPREDADPSLAARIRAKDVRVMRPTPTDAEPLHVSFVDMDPRARAAVLRLDPIADDEEYHVLIRMQDEVDRLDRPRLRQLLQETEDPQLARLGRRVENLGVLDWDVWAWGQQSVESVLATRPDATVLDLGHFQHRDESLVVALCVLDSLWAARAERRPLLIVIDEAHNLCPPNPETPLAKAVTERLIQIAAEGRKYGLWLLLSTQRPSKIHPNVISQCDNLCLMRTNSPRDLTELASVFGFAPQDLLDRAPAFRKGQALFAGSFMPEPGVIQVAPRMTREGGSDVAVPF